MTRQWTRAASPEGIETAERVLSRKGWTKTYLADAVAVDDDNRPNDKPVSRATIKRFFQGKRIQAALFGAICAALELDPDTIEASGRVAAVRSQPWLVPYRRNAFFHGRAAVVAALRETFGDCQTASQPVVQALSGLGGIGKTQVAVEYAYRYGPEYSAVLWVSAETETTRLGSIQKIAQALELPLIEHQSRDATLAAVLTWLAQTPQWLLVFDNADQPELLTSIVPKWGQGHILITSRAQRFDRLGLAQPVRLTTLSSEAAVAFLFGRTGQSPDDVQEASAARAIATELDGLPLALEQAAAYIVDRQTRFQDYLTSYRHHRFAVLQRSRPITGEYARSVANTWSLNFRQVEVDSPIAAALLRVSAFLAPEGIPYEVFEQGAEALQSPLKEALAIAPTDPTCVPEILMPLSRFSLVTIEPTARSYSLHRLVQEALRRDLAMDDVACQYWATQAIEMVGLVFPAIEVDSEFSCDRLLPHALVCQHWLEQYDYHSAEAARLLNQAGHYLIWCGRYAEAEPLVLAAVAMRQQMWGDAHLEVATSLYNLGAIYRAQGRFEAAATQYNAALKIRQTLLEGDHADIATSLNNLAVLHQYQGRFTEAESLQQAAIAMRTRLFGDDHLDLASSLSNLGLLYLEQQRSEDAEPLFLRVYDIYQRQLGDAHPYIATTLNNLALVYQAQQQFEAAEDSFQTALALYLDRFGEAHPVVATILNNIARLHKAQGKRTSARKLFEQSLALRRQVLGPQHPDVASTCYDLAELLPSQGEQQEALGLLLSAFQIQGVILGSNHPSTLKTKQLLDSLQPPSQ
ncbi:MAG: tetratricopeptide repeat protein [Cyanobacteria bacterium J06636_16]